jgi:hypothetical protein
LPTFSAIIIIYLLSMAWITVIAALASCNRLSDDTKILQLVSVIQSYVIVAFAFAVVGKATGFGQSPECNQEAVAVVFHPFSALKVGRIFGGCLVGLMAFAYTIMTARDYTAQVRKKVRESKQSPEEGASLPSIPPEPVRTPNFMHSVAADTAILERQVSSIQVHTADYLLDFSPSSRRTTTRSPEL